MHGRWTICAYRWRNVDALPTPQFRSDAGGGASLGGSQVSESSGRSGIDKIASTGTTFAGFGATGSSKTFNCSTEDCSIGEMGAAGGVRLDALTFLLFRLEGSVRVIRGGPSILWR